MIIRTRTSLPRLFSIPLDILFRPSASAGQLTGSDILARVQKIRRSGGLFGGCCCAEFWDRQPQRHLFRRSANELLEEVGGGCVSIEVSEFPARRLADGMHLPCASFRSSSVYELRRST